MDVVFVGGAWLPIVTGGPFVLQTRAERVGTIPKFAWNEIWHRQIAPTLPSSWQYFSCTLLFHTKRNATPLIDWRIATIRPSPNAFVFL